MLLRRPCFSAFLRTANFPADVFGPVDFFAFSRFACSFFSEMGLRFSIYPLAVRSHPNAGPAGKHPVPATRLKEPPYVAMELCRKFGLGALALRRSARSQSCICFGDGVSTFKRSHNSAQTSRVTIDNW
jgi:hypothetical protein